MAYQYDGSIIVRKVLKANLPSGRVAGNVWYFVVENEDDLVGEIWATNANGYLVNYSSSADLTELQKQINDCLSNEGLNSIPDIDNASKNFVAGLSETGHGTYPFSGWNNIVQFCCDHFVTQLGFSASESANNNRLAVRTRYSTGSFDKWSEIAFMDNGFNGYGSVYNELITDMNELKTPMVTHRVFNTTGVANFPPVALGATRMTIKVYFESDISSSKMLVQEIWFWDGAVSQCGYRRHYMDGTGFNPWFKIGG